MKRKTLSLLMSLAMTASTLLGSVGAMAVPVSAATGEVSDADCADNNTAEPASDATLPDANQYKYQKDELAAFCHFGPNTFNGYEWGFYQPTQTWYYEGMTANEIFRLDNDFDATTLVEALKSAGFKKLIVTAKHHDGFCIWNSAHTDYDVANTDYWNDPVRAAKRAEEKEKYGYEISGDVLAEISAACTAAGLDMGLYLSPWDVAEGSYGAEGGGIDNDYNKYYNNQLQEILSSPQYGNNGHFVEVWMDGANGYNNRPQTYNFEQWYSTIQKNEGIEAGFEADCMLFGAGTRTTVRWIGNESGLAADTTWAKSRIENGQIYNDDSQAAGDYKGDPKDGFSNGYENGNHWTVPEADARITSGWFWASNNNTPKTLTELANMYFNSVGHNATLLLNVPPNDEGTVDQAILERVAEFGQNIKSTFRTNLATAEGTTIVASDVRGNDIDFKPGNTVDGDDATYWTTSDGTKEGSLTIKWNTAKRFDVVSIEEAIQKGQHINNYKVEYKENDSASWKTLGSGVTIGAKRLIRTNPVSATQVRITVSTSDGKVPMISELGIYKASKGFELSGTAPDGMEIASVSDSSKFTFSGTWHAETGTQYINGNNKYSSAANASATYTFEGTKVYLMGTFDPNHGQADVYIDDMNTPVATIDTHATSRSTGARIFESADLTDGQHTIKIVSKTNAAIGLEAAYTVNNGGKGVLEIENSAYTMSEDSTLSLKIKRVGGTNGTITASLQPNPGSAIQKHFDTGLITSITFENGEKEKTIDPAARANRVPTTDGNLYFTLELSSTEPVVGLLNAAKVTIIDSDSFTKETLSDLISECEEVQEYLYTSGWDTFAAALDAAKEVAAKENPTSKQLETAYTTLFNAKEALVVREKYTENDRFQFPSKKNGSAVLEAEFAELINTDNDKDHQGGTWPLEVAEGAWASNGKYINSLNYEDVIKIPYHAEKAGVYTVVATYRSGSASNALAWSEPSSKITSGSVTAGATDGARADHTVTFEITVAEAGDGILTFTGPESDSPQLDKLVITPKNVTFSNYDITATAGAGGKITAEGLTNGVVNVSEGEDVVFTITPDDGYAVADVKVDGTSVGAKTSYTFKTVGADHKIEATFVFEKYTASNPFAFPTEKDATVTLEAEYATSIVDDPTTDSRWPLAVAEESWASNGKYLNCMANNDFAYYAYKAEKAGTYEVTLTYRSGDPNNANKLKWSESDGKITTGQITTPYTKENNALTAKTIKFELVVTTAGAGTLVLTAPDTGKGPQIDKFEIKLVKTTAKENPFVDVTENDYFEDAVLWAVENGITNGNTPTTFGPNNNCTRAQVVKFLYETAGAPDVDLSGPNPFSDVTTGGTFYKAIMWAKQNGITVGYTDGTFRPLDPVTRGEYIAFQYRAAGKPAVSFENPFSDIDSNHRYYNAIMWAAKNKITSGRNGKFLPDENCVRGQVITFLYNANHLKNE